jgi:rhodanese-related sulfurtransferase/DNA-binding transcriptional ArsR family regulator
MSASSHAFKEAVYEQFARIAKALSSPRRIELLDLLAQCSRTVEGLAQCTGMSTANTSQHLQVLRAAGLVEHEKQGVFVWYRLADLTVAEFLLTLRRLASERLAEVERILHQFVPDREPLQAVTREALTARVRRGDVVVLDVRPLEEYQAGHLPGALSIPLDELERRLGELPRDREVVAYCRGPYCLLAVEAAALLREHGFAAMRLDAGVQEWRAQGFALETGGPAAAASN